MKYRKILLLCLFTILFSLFSLACKKNSEEFIPNTENILPTSGTTSDTFLNQPSVAPSDDPFTDDPYTNTISREIKEKAKNFPDVTGTLPEWHGTHIADKGEFAWPWVGIESDPEKITEEHVAETWFDEDTVLEIAHAGYNFVRVIIDTRFFFTEDEYLALPYVGSEFYGSIDTVNLKQYKNLDDIITWCIENDIHVCIDCHSTPGGLMLGGDEEESRRELFTPGSDAQKIFVRYWEILAHRYADISPNALSFNLYNEPPFFVRESEDLYIDLMNQAIDKIQAVTPNRLIFVDAHSYSTTGLDQVSRLHANNLAIGFHLYANGSTWAEEGSPLDMRACKNEIEERMNYYDSWAKENNVRWMLQEYGCSTYYSQKQQADYLKIQVDTCKELGVPYCHYAFNVGTFGVCLWEEDGYQTPGAPYRKTHAGHLINTELTQITTDTTYPGTTGNSLIDPAVYYDRVDRRIAEIRASETTIEPVGTVFYISSSTGNDNNDGLSPETAWKTCARMNEDSDGAIKASVDKYGGATVLFKRGDVWHRDGIYLWYPNMIYSTYGEGEKPVFDFSLEDAANPEYWTLLEGTDNLWVYHKKVPFLGSMTLNDTYSADNHEGFYWDGVWYEACSGSLHWNWEGRICHYENKKLYDITALPNESFFVDVRPGNEWLNEASGQLYVYDCDEVGTLYFRCDEGNPGNVYESIDLCNGYGVHCGNACTYDNLVVKNVGNQAFSNFPGEECIGCTLQNCEVYFCGDQYINFDPENHIGYVGGECGGFHGAGSRYYNNYFYGSREGGFTVEIGWTGSTDGHTVTLGDVVAEGNVFHKCDGAIGIICFLKSADGIDMSDISICDNYFVEIGCYHDEDGNDPRSLGVIHVWDNSGTVNIADFSICDNLFLYTDDRVINLEQVENTGFLHTEGNTVILKKYSEMNCLRQTNQHGLFYYNTLEEIQPVIGDFGEILWTN